MTTERHSADRPALLEEYRRLSQADWDASRLEEDAKPEDENFPALKAAVASSELQAVENRITTAEAIQ